MTDEERGPENSGNLHSITRLLVGSVIWLSDGLESQLRKWEGKPEKQDQGETGSEGQTSTQDDPLPESLPAPQVGKSIARSPADVRYALIGLIFEGEEKLDEVLAGAKQLGKKAEQVFKPILKPVRRLGESDLVQSQIDQLAGRGQSIIDRWISRGVEEEARSLEFVEHAANSTVDQSVQYLAETEVVSDLLYTQSVSLSSQFLHLVRSMSFSTDYFLEGVVRYIFRLKPRDLLPPPDPKLQEQAAWSLQEFREKVL